MNVLILGSGGREHALGWKLKQSDKVEKIYFLPGNGGTAQVGKNIKGNPSNHHEVITLAKDNNVELVIVGSDQYLAEGIVDSLNNSNINVFGPHD